MQNNRMSSKNYDRFAILQKKSVLFFTVVITITLLFTYSQYYNYGEYYLHTDKTTEHLENYNKFYFMKEGNETDLPASITSSSFKIINTIITRYQTTSSEKIINDSVKSVQTTTASRDAIWFRKLAQLIDINQSDNNIFFIETSCGTEELMKTNGNNGVVHLNPRQCCAVESAALTNRNHNIYILHTCPLNVTIYKQSPKYIKQTLAHSNVHIIYLTLGEVFHNSPLEELYHSNKIASSRYPVEHISDILRLLVLWKFGGTYLDLDTINIRPLDDLKSNYAGWEDSTTIANGVLNFKYTGTGHNIVTNCLKELNSAFNGSEWSNNGPLLVTRILIQMCKVKTVAQLAKEKCNSFKIYPPKYFYPIYYQNYDIFFKDADPQTISYVFNGTYSIHFWNKMSYKSVIEVGSNQLYGILADKYCPGIYHTCGKYF